MATATEVKAPKFLEKKTSNGMLVFNLGNGSKVTFDPAKCSDAIRQQAMLHGFGQKIGDAAAGFAKDKDHAGAIAEMQAVIDSLYGNEWNRKGERQGIALEDLAAAIAQVKKVPVDKARAAVEKATNEQRKEWSKNVQVAKVVAELQLARLAAAASGDGGELNIELE